jgi:DNA-binding transcriptional regulator YdaS (Cro superfamily)
MTLSDYLAANDITRAEFAAKIAVSQGFVSMLCNGVKRPSLQTLADIQRVTKGEVALEDFLQ